MQAFIRSNPLCTELWRIHRGAGPPTALRWWATTFTLTKEQATLFQRNSSVILGLYALADMGIHYDGWKLADAAAFFHTYGITDDRPLRISTIWSLPIRPITWNTILDIWNFWNLRKMQWISGVITLRRCGFIRQFWMLGRRRLMWSRSMCLNRNRDGENSIFPVPDDIDPLIRIIAAMLPSPDYWSLSSSPHYTQRLHPSYYLFLVYMHQFLRTLPPLLPYRSFITFLFADV